MEDIIKIIQEHEEQRDAGVIVLADEVHALKKELSNAKRTSREKIISQGNEIACLEDDNLTLKNTLSDSQKENKVLLKIIEDMTPKPKKYILKTRKGAYLFFTSDFGVDFSAHKKDAKCFECIETAKDYASKNKCKIVEVTI